MKIITSPQVYLVGKQQVIQEDLDAFLRDLGVEWKSDSEEPGEVLAEAAGRLCYLSYGKPRPGGNKAYLHHIKESGHGSVLEHAVYNFIITGVSRSLTHELVRHRAGLSPSMLSQRYVDESVAEFVVPPDLNEEVDAAVKLILYFNMSEPLGTSFAEKLEWTLGNYQQSVAFNSYAEPTKSMVAIGLRWLESMHRANKDYCYISDYLAKKATVKGLEKTEARKFARQAARSVLPNATETKIFITINARAARHFIEQRGSRFADPEIRKLANQMLSILRVESPNLFGDYKMEPLPDGTYEITTPYRKV